MKAAEQAARRSRASLRIMDLASDLRFAAPVIGYPTRRERLGQAFFLARAQALRMPPAMLARHLIAKTLRRIGTRSAPANHVPGVTTAVADAERG
jgi:hypothetical protein